MVKTPPINTYLFIWSLYHKCSIPPDRSGSLLLGSKWNLEGGGGRPGWLRCRSYRLVPERRMDEGNGWWIYRLQ